MITLIFGPEQDGVRSGASSVDASNPQSVMPVCSENCLSVEIDDAHPAWQYRSWILSHPNYVRLSGGTISIEFPEPEVPEVPVVEE